MDEAERLQCRAALTGRAWIETGIDMINSEEQTVARPSRAARGLKLWQPDHRVLAPGRAALTGRAWIETPPNTSTTATGSGRAALTGRAWIETAP